MPATITPPDKHPMSESEVAGWIEVTAFTLAVACGVVLVVAILFPMAVL